MQGDEGRGYQNRISASKGGGTDPNFGYFVRTQQLNVPCIFFVLLHFAPFPRCTCFLLFSCHIAPFLCCTLSILHVFCVSTLYVSFFLCCFVLHSCHVALFLCCILKLNFFQVTLFLCFPFFIMQCFHLELFSWRTLFMLHLFSRCTLFTLHHFFLFWTFFILHLFLCCILFMLYPFFILDFFHVPPSSFCISSLVAFFSCCTFFSLEFHFCPLSCVPVSWCPFWLLRFHTLRYFLL